MLLKCTPSSPMIGCWGHCVLPPDQHFLSHQHRSYIFKKPICACKGETSCAWAAWGGWVLKSPLWIRSLWRHLRRGIIYSRKTALCAIQARGQEWNDLTIRAYLEPPAGLGDSLLLPCRGIRGVGPGLWGWAATSLEGLLGSGPELLPSKCSCSFIQLGWCWGRSSLNLVAVSSGSESSRLRTSASFCLSMFMVCVLSYVLFISWSM